MLHAFWRRLRHGERGFTLIELLIVVAIIAILAAILIPNFLRARAQSQVSATKGNMKNLATALESYFVDKNSYPAGGGGQSATTPPAGLDALDPDYIRAVPRDPCTNEYYAYTVTGSAPDDYTLSIAFPAGNRCDPLIGTTSDTPDITYQPGGGLSP